MNLVQNYHNGSLGALQYNAPILTLYVHSHGNTWMSTPIIRLFLCNCELVQEMYMVIDSN